MFIHGTAFERNSVCYIRFPFPYSVLYFALPSLYPRLLILFQFILLPSTKNAKRTINATSISNVFVACASHYRNENVTKIINLDYGRTFRQVSTRRIRLLIVETAYSDLRDIFFHNFRDLQWIPLRKVRQPTSKQQLWRILGFHFY